MLLAGLNRLEIQFRLLLWLAIIEAAALSGDHFVFLNISVRVSGWEDHERAN